MAFFETKNCSITFGGLKALTDINLTLNAGEILGVIGPNGAGKTTFFNLITGVYEPSDGDLFLEGKKLNQLSATERSQMGIARTFQNIRLFAGLTVAEQVQVASLQGFKAGFYESILQTKKYGLKVDEVNKNMAELLGLFDLNHLANTPAIDLSYGDQRRLEIVRALATNPKLLLLDEPAAGMNATEKKTLVSLIQKIHQEFKLTLILIEHDMSVVMSLCPRIVVLDYGVAIAEGSPAEIRSNPKVIEAYLGEVIDA